MLGLNQRKEKECRLQDGGKKDEVERKGQLLIVLHLVQRGPRYRHPILGIWWAKDTGETEKTDIRKCISNKLSILIVWRMGSQRRPQGGRLRASHSLQNQERH